MDNSTIQIKKPLEKAKLHCQIDNTPLDCKCPACLIINRGNRAKIYHCAKSLYWHLVQCPNFTKITTPNRVDSIQMLENITIANSFGMIP